MKANEPKTALERGFEAELPQILRLSDSDLEGALAALDRYLDQAPPPAFQKALLAWKGRFYLEHAKYDDAIRELQTADAIQIPDELQNFNTKTDLARALTGAGHPQEAYTALTEALNETEDPRFLLMLLGDLMMVRSNLNLALPARAQIALSRVKQFFGIDDQPALLDLPSEIARVVEFIRQKA